jgi:hypothetical protein
MIVRGYNEFYDGWLAWLFHVPRDETKSDVWKDGWDMAAETGIIAGSILREEVKRKHVIVEAER